MTTDLYWVSDISYVLLLILLLKSDPKTRIEKESGKSFRKLIAWCVFFCLQDMLWGMCYTGVIQNDTLLFATSSIFHISAVITTFFWVNYVLDFLEKKDKVGKFLLTFDFIVIFIEFVVILINCFKPILFTVINGQYSPNYLRTFTFFNQYTVYLLIGILTLFYGCKEKDEIREKYLAVFSFTMVPILLGALQMLFPDGPFYSMAYCISCYIIHIFIVVKEREKAIEEITTLNAQLQDNQIELEASAEDQEVQIQEIQQLNQEIQTRMSIIRSVIKVYFAAYYVDIEADTYAELSSIENIRQHGFDSHGKAQESLTQMCSVLIHPEYIEAMKEFVDLSTLSQRLKNTNTVTMQYIGNTTGWSQAYSLLLVIEKKMVL